jgi:hypothetical protein
MKARLVLVAAVAASVCTRARGDAPAPEGYFGQVDGATVTVYLNSSSHRGCPDQGLLRRDVDTGDIVKLTTCTDATTFVDQCVPSGSYQYGLAEPMACSRYAGTEYYTEVTVTDGAPSDCARTVDAPTAAASVPWGASQWVCRSSHPDPGGCATGGAVLGANAAALAFGLALWRRRARGAAAGSDRSRP